MAARSKRAFIEKTVEDMKTLGVYKPEYDRTIEIYAELNEQYVKLMTQFKKSGYQYQVPTADGGFKKAPIVATLETLRKDILAYTDRLCLNPKAKDGVTVETKKKSALAAALSALE